MTVTGYSDVINHALAFSAKHHDRQVRKGTKLPYLTHPANVAIILTRYGRDNDTVVAGILHDVIEDCVRDGYTRDMLEQRIGDKFGAKVLETVSSFQPTRGEAIIWSAWRMRTMMHAGSVPQTRSTTHRQSSLICGEP